MIRALAILLALAPSTAACHREFPRFTCSDQIDPSARPIAARLWRGRLVRLDDRRHRPLDEARWSCVPSDGRSYPVDPG